MRPFQDQMWGRLPSGALVWMEGGLPTRVRLTGQAAVAVDVELSNLTGAMFRLGKTVGYSDTWVEREVLQVATREQVRIYRDLLVEEYQEALRVEPENARLVEERLYAADRALAALLRAMPRAETKEGVVPTANGRRRHD